MFINFSKKIFISGAFLCLLIGFNQIAIADNGLENAGAEETAGLINYGTPNGDAIIADFPAGDNAAQTLANALPTNQAGLTVVGFAPEPGKFQNALARVGLKNAYVSTIKGIQSAAVGSFAQKYSSSPGKRRLLLAIVYATTGPIALFFYHNMTWNSPGYAYLISAIYSFQSVYYNLGIIKIVAKLKNKDISKGVLNEDRNSLRQGRLIANGVINEFFTILGHAKNFADLGTVSVIMSTITQTFTSFYSGDKWVEIELQSIGTSHQKVIEDFNSYRRIFLNAVGLAAMSGFEQVGHNFMSGNFSLNHVHPFQVISFGAYMLSWALAKDYENREKYFEFVRAVPSKYLSLRDKVTEHPAGAMVYNASTKTLDALNDAISKLSVIGRSRSQNRIYDINNAELARVESCNSAMHPEP
jgi:hypothetical protein